MYVVYGMYGVRRCYRPSTKLPESDEKGEKEEEEKKKKERIKTSRHTYMLFGRDARACDRVFYDNTFQQLDSRLPTPDPQSVRRPSAWKVTIINARSKLSGRLPRPRVCT